MVENFIALAVPLFVVAVIAEILVGRRRGLYNAGTGLSDLGAGIVSVVADSFLRILGVGAYAWVYETYRLHTFDEGSPWLWVVGLVGVDFIYYWWHRASHVVNALWAVHVVHHHSEDFNFAVALRQPAFEATAVLLFYLPLAVMGVSPVVYLASYAINLFYQFWVHTELVGKLGPIEWLLNTPSHHRVHHGVNPKYLDRNYAGVLILWDRLFGTFQVEKEPVVFGVTTPLRSYNPLWANVEYWVTLWKRAKAAPNVGSKVRVLVAHPAWRPGGARDEPREVSRDSFEKYRCEASGPQRRYIAMTFAVTLGLVGGFFYLEGSASAAERLPLGAVVLVSVGTMAGILEGRSWARPLDRIRQVALIGALAVYMVPRVPGTVAASVLMAVALCSHLASRRWLEGGGRVAAVAAPDAGG